MNQQTAENLMKITEKSYQKIASSFSDTRNFSWGEVDLAITKYLKDDVKILDLGCGNGRLLISLKKYLKSFDYLGVDSCKELVEKAQSSFAPSQLPPLSFPTASPRIRRADRESRNIIFKQDNILNLTNLADNSFDCVFMIASFNHIASQKLREKLLLEIKRVLKSNGVLIMTNWNLWQINSKKSFWHNKKKSAYYGLHATDYKEIVTLWQNKHPLYYHAFTLQELKKLLQKTNFKILENYYITNGKKVRWYSGRNILTAARKI